MADLNTLLSSIGTALTGVSNEIIYHSSVSTIPIFYGDPAGCEDFVRCLDMVSSIIKSEKGTVRAALMRSRGIVAETIKAYIETTDQANFRWPALKKILETSFGITTDPRTALAILRNTKQEKGISILHYAKLLSIRAPRAWPDDNVTDPHIQKQIVEVFINGLQSDYIRRRLIVKDVKTLEEAQKLAFDENVVQERLNAFTFRAASGASAPRQQRQDNFPEAMEVDAIQASTLQASYTAPATSIPPEMYEDMLPSHEPLADFADPHYHQGYPADTQPDAMNEYLNDPYTATAHQDPNAVYDNSGLYDSVVDYGDAAPHDDYRPPEDPESLFAIKGQQPSQNNRRCYICDADTHLFKQCPVRTQRFNAPRPMTGQRHPAPPLNQRPPAPPPQSTPYYRHPYSTPNTQWYPRYRYPAQPGYRYPQHQYAYARPRTPQQTQTRPAYQMPQGQATRPSRFVRPQTGFR